MTLWLILCVVLTFLPNLKNVLFYFKIIFLCSVISVVGIAIRITFAYSLHFIFISVKCLNCKGVSDTFDPYLDITLEIKVRLLIVVARLEKDSQTLCNFICSSFIT